jgi:hypothetical protein
MLKCAGSEDIITMSAQDEVDRVTFVFESPSTEPVTQCGMKCEEPPEPCCPQTHLSDDCMCRVFSCCNRKHDEETLTTAHP